MKGTAFVILVILAVSSAIAAAASTAARPYSGIGVLLLATYQDREADILEQAWLYREPAVSRQGPLNIASAPRYEAFFGTKNETRFLIVTARKGEWLRVVYDDAGREAWLPPRRSALFRPWDEFLKGQEGRLLPGLQKRYYQLFRQPGKEALATLTPKHSFRVVKLEHDWSLVMPDQNTLGWLRWRDDDGRLLFVTDMAPGRQNR
jgi:hypothetical protein